MPLHFCSRLVPILSGAVIIMSIKMNPIVNDLNYQNYSIVLSAFNFDETYPIQILILRVMPVASKSRYDLPVVF